MYKILVVDDTQDVLLTMSGILQDAHFDVVALTNPVEAFENFVQSDFDFALIDVRLFGGGDEDNSGLLLGLTIKMLRPTTGVILFSAHRLTRQIDWVIQNYGILAIQKNPNMDHEILEAIKDTLIKKQMSSMSLEDASFNTSINYDDKVGKDEDAKKIASYLQEEKDLDISFSLSLHSQSPVQIRSRGSFVFSGLEIAPLNLDVKKYVRKANIALAQDDWRISVEEVGIDLWNNIFRSQPEVMSAYAEARGRSQNISIYYEIPRESIGLPLEFIKTSNPLEYMILQHPVTRIVTSISPKRECISPEFLRLNKLNVLIIGSNTTPDIPGVEVETQKIFNILSQHVKIDNVKLIPTNDATYDVVCEEISRSKYDIIHYSGHGEYNDYSPEKSCLFFWRQKDRKGGISRLEVSDLTDLLRTSETRFLYLSSCYGTKSSPSKDIKDDFQGAADAVIQSGVPSVLGFRVPVSDVSAVNFAESFYKNLLRSGRLELATWEARRRIARNNRDDQAWLSPILISQY